MDIAVQPAANLVIVVAFDLDSSGLRKLAR
jgi:hypothetical protein